MTLSLYVLRHAKAEEAAPGSGDHERALKGRGRKAAKLVGRALSRLDEAPQRVLCSTAVRARETAEAVLAAGGFGARLELRREIYEGSCDGLLALLSGLEADYRRVLLVGHQPGLSLLIARLTGGEPAFPTAALARVDFEVERWGELAPLSGHMVWLFPFEALAALVGGD